MARVWDEAILELIRLVIPAPTVHARNLYHLSAAMWDAWAVYDRSADGVFVTEKHDPSEVQAAREAAISFAAFRILAWRYGVVSDLKTAQESLDKTMAALCFRTDVTTTEGDSPAAVGNRIAAAPVIAAGRSDGAREEERYADADYKPVNEPLEVGKPGTVMADQIAGSRCRSPSRSPRTASRSRAPSRPSSGRTGARHLLRAAAIGDGHAHRPRPAAPTPRCRD